MKDVVSQSCAGSNFDAERDKMAANDSYGLLSVDIDITNGALTFGISEPTSGTTWLVWDNFRLLYKGQVDTGIDDAVAVPAATGAIYDLQGRRLSAKPQRGIYILNGKKYVR